MALMVSCYAPLSHSAANRRFEFGKMANNQSRSLWVLGPVFPLSRFLSANRQFVGARANNFWQYSKHSFRKINKFWKYDIWYTLILDWYEI